MTMRGISFIVAVPLLLLARSSAVAAEEEDHDHGSGSGTATLFEYAGLYATPEAAYTLVAAEAHHEEEEDEGEDEDRRRRSEDEHEGEAIRVAVFALPDGDEETLHGAESEGEHALEQDCTEIDIGETIVPAEDVCFELHLTEGLWQTPYVIDTSGTKFIAIFSEHDLSEFNGALVDDEGEEVAALHTIPEARVAKSNPRWGITLGAVIIVWFCTLIGLILMVPAVKRLQGDHPVEFLAIVQSFGAGSILACAVFLMLLESSHYMVDQWDEEVDVTWRWGTMVLAGLISAWAIDLMAIAIAGQNLREARSSKVNKIAPSGDGDGDGGGGAVLGADQGDAPPTNEAMRIIASILLTDFLHNFTDGIFIGAAFQNCSTSFGWAVAAGTIYHEIAQELADFILLTTRAGMGPMKALLLNWASGFSVVLGAITIMASGIDNHHVGLILAYGGGVYLEIGATECLSSVFAAKLSMKYRLITMGAFIVGATAIGLVLLDHEHCPLSGPPAESEADSDDPHAGHGH